MFKNYTVMRFIVIALKKDKHGQSIVRPTLLSAMALLKRHLAISFFRLAVVGINLPSHMGIIENHSLKL